VIVDPSGLGLAAAGAGGNSSSGGGGGGGGGCFIATADNGAMPALLYLGLLLVMGPGWVALGFATKATLGRKTR
jgi:hypothetical protein